MDAMVYLRDIVVILTLAVVIVALFHKMKLPSIAAFILAGIMAGPQGFGLVADLSRVEVLAEIGVALLLFGIGLELPLEKLRRLWKLVVVGGFLQVGLSILATFGVARFWGLPPRTAIFIGYLLALSSTAIVLRGLQQRSEVDAPHGRLILGILVFQDFCVVPMMLSLPLLAGADVSSGDLIAALLWSMVIIIGVLLVALVVVPRLLHVIAATRQRHLFILTVFLICLGTAWLITSSGASLAIGAFLAGLAVAGSEYRHQALADLISFREVFASLFFVSVGMMLSPLLILENTLPILALLTAIMVGKALIVFTVALLIRMPLRVAMLSAVALAQIGEFSFVLSYAAEGFGLLDNHVESNLLGAAILSMFFTPLAIAFGPHLAAQAGRLRGLSWLFRITAAEKMIKTDGPIGNHVIIGGYGFAGQELARALNSCNVPFVIVDLNMENVARAAAQGYRAFFGDVTSQEVLNYAGIRRAKELVLLINDPAAAEQAVKISRNLSADLYIAVRTNYLRDIGSLRAAGASEVISAEQEAAVEVTSTILNRYRLDAEKVGEVRLNIRGRTEEAAE